VPQDVRGMRANRLEIVRAPARPALGLLGLGLVVEELLLVLCVLLLLLLLLLLELVLVLELLLELLLLECVLVPVLLRLLLVLVLLWLLLLLLWLQLRLLRLQLRLLRLLLLQLLPSHGSSWGQGSTSPSPGLSLWDAGAVSWTGNQSARVCILRLFIHGHRPG